MNLTQVLLLSCLSLVAAQHPAPKPSSQPAEKPRNELRFTPWRTRISVAIYQLTLSADRADELDSDKLRQSAKSQELHQALKALGETRLINMTDQFVGEDSEQTLRLGASRPTPTGSQSFKGQTSTHVSYQDTGCILEVKNTWSKEDPTRGMIDLGIELSCIGASQIQIAPGTMAPVIYQMQEKLFGPIRSGEPDLLFNVDGNNQGSEIHVYVTRVVLHRTNISDVKENTIP